MAEQSGGGEGLSIWRQASRMGSRSRVYPFNHSKSHLLPSVPYSTQHEKEALSFHGGYHSQMFSPMSSSLAETVCVRTWNRLSIVESTCIGLKSKTGRLISGFCEFKCGQWSRLALSYHCRKSQFLALRCSSLHDLSLRFSCGIWVFLRYSGFVHHKMEDSQLMCSFGWFIV